MRVVGVVVVHPHEERLLLRTPQLPDRLVGHAGAVVELAGAQAFILYGFAILAVFLCLSALYESWSIPLSVLLVVPLGVLGVLLAVTLRGYSNDVYFQVALITIIGLSAKNAILIIEFAKDLQAQGKTAVEAALDRDNFMTPQMAKDFGLIDQNVDRREAPED